MGKRWVIPDIHGYYNTLKCLIEKKISPSKEDTLYFLGDYIDRGPNSKAVLDYLIALDNSDQPTHFIKGNHEDFLQKIYYAKRGFKPRQFFKKSDKAKWKKFGGRKTLKSFKIKNPKAIPQSYINWIENLPIYIEMEDFILVHAGIDCLLEDIFSDEDYMMWTNQFEVIPERVNNRRVIFGHSPQPLDSIHYCISKNIYNKIGLDNAIYKDKEGYGNLVALELNSMELIVQNNLG